MGTQIPENDQGFSQGENTGDNPAWAEFLALVPEDQHSQAREELKKWDQGVNERFTARAKEIEPYKPFLDKKVPPQTIEQGLTLIEALQTRPDEYFKSLAQSLGIDTVRQLLELDTPGETPPGEEDPDAQKLMEMIDKHPAFKQIKEQLESLATVVVGDRESQQISQQQDQLASDISNAEDKFEKQYGRKFDEFETEHIIQHLLYNENATVDDAVNNMIEYQQRMGLIQTRPPAPNVLGGQGGNPTTPFDPRKLTDDQRQEAAVDMLKRLNANKRENA